MTAEDQQRRSKRFEQHRSQYERGFVSQIQIEDGNPTGFLRVTFPDYQNMESWWLNLVVRKSQSAKDWWMPEVGELVACLMDENLEDGVVLGALYSTADKPPSEATAQNFVRTFEDASVIEYDPVTHALSATLPAGGTAVISAPAGITANGVAIDHEGNVSTLGKMTAADFIVGTTGITGATHEHISASPGDPTSEPIPG